MVFGNGVKNIQAAAYNGARTVVCSFKIGFIFYVTDSTIVSVLCQAKGCGSILWFEFMAFFS